MSGCEDRISLRGLVLSDAATMAQWAADPEFCRAAGWSTDLEPRAHLEFQRKIVLDPPADLLRLGVEFSGGLVGYVDLHGSEPRRRKLGFLIGERRLWGRGLGRRAAAAALEHGFVRLGLEEIWAEALEANAGSMRILLGLGFRSTGTGVTEECLGVPSVYRRFALSAGEWAAGDRDPAGVPMMEGQNDRREQGKT
jgi:RimJ/RimL family protein N-acetyltransferase